MLSTALISATAPARRANSASVLAALSRIAWAKADHKGICASVTPSCDCKARIRWSMAAWVAADISGGAEAAAAGEPGAAGGGAPAGAAGIEAVPDAVCARPIAGASKIAKATLRQTDGENM